MLASALITLLLFLYLSLIGYLFSAIFYLGYGYLKLRLVINFCLGLLVSSNCLLLLSLFKALNLNSALLIFCILALINYKLKRKNTYLNYLNDLKKNSYLVISSAICASIFSLHPVIYGDTIGYHYPLVQWLKSYGLVPGLSWVYFPFANMQGWYSLFSLVDRGILEGRIGTLGGVLSCFLIFLATSIAIKNLKTKLNSFAHLLLIFGLSSFYLSLINYHNILSSLAPDLMAQLIVIIVCSLYLHNSFAQKIRLKLALVIALLSLSLRASNLVLIAFISLIYLLHFRSKSKFLIISIPICLMPSILASIVTSGWLLFPTPFFKFNFDYSLSYAYVFEVYEHVTINARCCGFYETNTNVFLDWFIPWLKHEYSIKEIFIAMFISWFYFLLVKKHLSFKTKIILAFHFFSIGFVIIKMPATRYGAIYFLISFALSLAHLLEQKPNILKRLFYMANVSPFILALGYFYLHPIKQDIYQYFLPKLFYSDQLFNEGLSVIKAKRFKEAYILFSQAYELNKNNKNAHYNKLLALSHLSNQEVNSLEVSTANLDLKTKQLDLILPQTILKNEELFVLKQWSDILELRDENLGIRGGFKGRVK